MDTCTYWTAPQQCRICSEPSHATACKLGNGESAFSHGHVNTATACHHCPIACIGDCLTVVVVYAAGAAGLDRHISNSSCDKQLTANCFYWPVGPKAAADKR